MIPSSKVVIRSIELHFAVVKLISWPITDKLQRIIAQLKCPVPLQQYYIWGGRGGARSKEEIEADESRLTFCCAFKIAQTTKLLNQDNIIFPKWKRTRPERVMIILLISCYFQMLSWFKDLWLDFSFLFVRIFEFLNHKCKIYKEGFRIGSVTRMTSLSLR